MSHTKKPGENVSRNCECEVIDENGRSTGEKVSMRKGQSLPPTDKKGQAYSTKND